MQTGSVVAHQPGGVMPAETVVMHAGRGVMHAAGGDLQIGLEDSRVARVVMHEGRAVSRVLAEVREIPGAVLRLARWVFSVVAGVGHGSEGMGPARAYGSHAPLSITDLDSFAVGETQAKLAGELREITVGG
jgi:hypothetical protein